ncbi:MAG: dihydrofolate reductase [Candidatus Peregrinibacteria bacterium Gr01-1014_25]|nr:MAG: dihydrofolate reductase [Candidatus Peregrinibacteria bacterium Gr01-1014_25]
MRISLIVAASENDVIGKNGTLPWHLPDDWKHFRDLTKGHPVIMGRKTYASIGRPLPERLNIVITRQSKLIIEGCTVVASLDDALRIARESGAQEAFVIGGGEIYRDAARLADVIYLTRVHTTTDGDVTFPTIDPDAWREVAREEHPADEKHAHAFTFLTYERKK